MLLQKKSGRVIGLLFLVIAFSSASLKYYSPLRSSTPPTGCTGATGKYCTSCHNDFALNVAGGGVSLTGLPSTFSASTKYNFSLTLSHALANRAIWGFSIIAVNNVGTVVGTFSTTNPNAAVNGTELAHNGAVVTGLQSTYTYTNLSWTAPSTTSGDNQTIKFYFTGIAGDNNGNNNGDYTYAASQTITAGAVTCTDAVNMVPSGTSGYTVVGDTVKVCGDSVILDAGTGHTTYLWTTGATTQKITAKAKGWYKVSTTNSSGCTGKDSAYVSIAKANIINNDSTICKGSAVTLSVGTLGTNTVRWSTGATTSSITVAPAVSTTYYATVTDGITSCQDSVRLSLASVDTSITALDPVTVCSNTGQVRLKAGIATSYQWLKDGSPLSGSTAQNYTATLSGSYRVVVTNATSCRDTSRAITVSISSLPVPAFTINSTSQCLTGNSFALTNTSTVSSGSLTYSWNFGDGTSAATTNTTHTYAAAGTFSIKLIATSSSGCKDSSSQSVTVNPLPNVTVNSGAICQGSSITLTASGADTYQWTPSTGLSATTGASVTATPSATTIYSVTGTLTSTGCTKSVNSTVTVNPQVTPSVSITSSNSGAVTPSATVTFTATALNGGSTPVYQWRKNDVMVGSNSATYSNSSWVDGDTVNCTLTSNATCATTATAVSNTLTIPVSNVITYCASSGSSTKEFIQRFQCNDLNNTSGNNGGMGSYTSLYVNVEKGKTYSLSIIPGWVSTTRGEGYAVWIDYNKDGDFADAGELVFSQAKTTATSVSGSITIPSTATVAGTRLRVSMKYNAIPGSCETGLPGEVEEYTINILEPVIDLQSPTAPSSLVADSIGSTAVRLSWAAGTDNIAVAGYDIYVNSLKWGSVTSTSASVTGLTAKTNYTFEVKSRDGAGNLSSTGATLTVTTLAPDYCLSNGTTTVREYINNFQLGTFTNLSGSNTGYGKFTGLTINAVAGQTYTVMITPAWNGSARSEAYRVWIDLNQDGDFADAGEQVFNQSKTTALSISGSIVIPASATKGATRLRVTMKYNSSPGPCDVNISGEVEDYTISIQ